MAYQQSVMDKMREIAQDCQGSQTSYCNARCPMHTDATKYIQQISENKLEDAIVTIREKLFLPGSLGRVCAHPCETECRRNTEYGQPLSIAALKRYAADKADKEELWDVSKKPSSGKKTAVIGAGPAGAQAAIDLAKEGHAVTVYEKLPVVGGMMRVGIPEYRLPAAVIDFEYKYLSKLGIELKLGVEVGKDVTFDSLISEHDAVVLANGAHKSFVPSVAGMEGVEGITNAVDFLKETSLGENNFEVKGDVIVIGGGDVSMDCARTAARRGARSVTTVSLECLEELPASAHEQDGAIEEGVAFACGWCAEEVISEGGRIKAVTFVECTSCFDAQGNFAPTFGDDRRTIECATLIFATGQIVLDVTEGALEQGGGGRYVADKQTLATKLDKVFVAGDNAGGTIVVEAMALGRKAAISVNRFLAGQDISANRDFENEYDFKSQLDIPLPKDVEDLPRKHTTTIPVVERNNFSECDLGFDDETALAESSRCLKCECKECMRECIMLNDFTQYPGALFKKFLEDGDIEPIVAYSCNMCDQCTLVCPKEFKFAELFGAIRKDMVKANNGQSPIPGHKAINMHQLLGFSKLFTVRIKGGGK